ncbi:MAG TPA: glycosyltransferase [Acidimicrobiales bacterium]|nr:glycosyltransferase [Acidimicrobiales bacterium]
MSTAAVAICTFNRPDQLRQALRAWAASSRRPDQVVVVDASPDAAAAARRVPAEHAGLFGEGSAYLVADRASTTAQRNQAVDSVTTDVVVFADDDTIPDRDYLARLLAVFEADPGGRVGGVAGTTAEQHHLSWRARQRLRELGVARLVGTRYPVPRRVAYPAAAAPPPLPPALHLVRKRALNGCNMAFRTALVAEARFDEHMGGYAYGEDFDLSFRIGRHHALLKRSDANVEMAVSHGSTVDPYYFFMIRWLNPAYLVAKHGLGEQGWRSLERLLVLERAADLARGRAPSAPDRESVRRRYATAGSLVEALRGAPPDDLVPRYEALQAEVAEGEPAAA